jgi:UPF0176 protein
MTIAVAAFYKFVAIDDPEAVRAHLYDVCAAEGVKGTILLAHEGINGTISAEPPAMTRVLATIRADQRFADLTTKDALTNDYPFKRLKVKLKREILAFGLPTGDPTVQVGTYVAPRDWNALISKPDVLVLDTRNIYEFEAGTFANAVDPHLKRFRDFPAYVKANLDPARDKKVAMFCTGGIRCEKASAYMKSLGFAEVYHLQGGILQYLADVPIEQRLWHGGCFVFDERETVETIRPVPKSIPGN